jgi:hypothetical protein
MSFLMRRKKGAGVGRVFAFASIANQPHALENKYVPGAGVGVSSISARRALSRRATICRSLPVIPLPPSTPEIYSKDNITIGGEFIIGNIVDKRIGVDSGDGIINSGMADAVYTDTIDPNNYPQFFPDMAPFTEENIVAGDKGEDKLMASYWNDLGDDIFDGWGFFYLYDVNSGKYYFPLINPQNGDDGVIATQTFNAFGRTFTIKHGWLVQGIFKFDILAADGLPFRFGAYGNMGSDGYEVTESLTQNYSIGGQNLTLYYHRDQEEDSNNEQEEDSNNEQLYSYWIPTKISENSAQTYDVYYSEGGGEGEGEGEGGRDNMSMLSKEVTSGLIVYFAKTNDVKDWVINDLNIIT